MNHLHRKRLRPISVWIVVLALVSSCSGPSVEELLTKAKQAQQSGEYRTASIHLKNVIQKDFENIEARIRFGQVSMTLGDVVSAEASFRKALRLGADAQLIHLPLMQSLSAGGKYQDVIDEADLGLAINDDERLALLLTLGEAFFGLGLTSEAEGRFREALAMDPDSLEASVGLAQLMIGSARLQEADVLIARALDPDDEYVPALLLRGIRETMEGRYPEAEATFNQVLELHGNQRGRNYLLALMRLTEIQLAQNRVDEALQSAGKLLALGPENPAALYLRARVAAQMEDLALATEYLLDILSKAPDHSPAQRLLGAIHSIEGNLGSAAMYLAPVVRNDPQDTFARRLLAEVRIRQNRPEEAIDLLTPVIQSDGTNTRFLALAGQASLQAGDRESARSYFQKSIESDPGNTRLQLNVASVYLASGELERAISVLESLPETSEQSVSTEYLLVLAHLRNRDTAAAIDVSQRLVERNSQAPWAHNLLGSVQLIRKDYTAARAAFEQAVSLDGKNIAAFTNLARLEIRLKQPDKAADQLKKILEVDPQNSRAMLSLAQAELGAGRRDKAKSWLRRAQDADPDALAPHFLLARVLSQEGDLAGAKRAAQEAVGMAPEKPKAHRLLGEVLLAAGDRHQALVSFKRAAELAPGAFIHQVNIARAQLANADSSGAVGSLNKARTLNPEYTPPVTLLTAVTVNKEIYDGVTRLLNGIRDRTPTSASRYVLEGSLNVFDKRYAEAAKAYSQAYTLAPSRHLAFKAYAARSSADMASPLAELNAWLDNHPDDHQARFARATALQGRGNPKAAIRDYERLVAANPNNAAALNNLAWVYHLQANPKAVEIAEKAYEILPDNGAITDTLGWLYVENGEPQRGLELLRQAAEKSPNELDIHYHLAVALAKVGDSEAAKMLLSEMLASGREFNAATDAQALLDRL